MAHDWRLFDYEEPIGNREIRAQLARVCAILTNAYRSKGSAEASDEEFLFRSPYAELAAEVEMEQAKKTHMIRAFQALAIASGPRPLRRRKARR